MKQLLLVTILVSALVQISCNYILNPRHVQEVNYAIPTQVNATVDDQLGSLMAIGVEAPERKDASDAMDYFAENGFGKPLSTLQHPAGEYYEGVTYLAYQGPHEDPYVCAYDHRTEKWTGPIQAGVSALGDDPPATDPDEIDNHGRPALIVDGRGYIHLVFGGHGGDRGLGSNPLGFNGSGKQTHVVSKNPGDISSWEILDNIPPFGTYSQFLKMSNGNIYLFYRHGSHRSDWVYQKSTDHGRTFTQPVSILRHKPQMENPKVYDSWYAWFGEGPDNTIITAFNYHPCATRPDHSSLRLNAYVMKMNTVDDSWENVKGEKLMIPLTKESADSMAMVHNSKGEGTRLGTILADAAGNPHAYFRISSKKQSFLYHSWTGEAWHTGTIMDPKFSDGELFMGKDQKIKLLAVRQNGDFGEIGWWNANSTHWEKEEPLLSTTKAKFVMSAFIRNAHPDARVIVAEIPIDPIGLHSKLYLLGNAGPVKRTQSQKD